MRDNTKGGGSHIHQLRYNILGLVVVFEAVTGAPFVMLFLRRHFIVIALLVSQAEFALGAQERRLGARCRSAPLFLRCCRVPVFDGTQGAAGKATRALMASVRAGRSLGQRCVVAAAGRCVGSRREGAARRLRPGWSGRAKGRVDSRRHRGRAPLSNYGRAAGMGGIDNLRAGKRRSVPGPVGNGLRRGGGGGSVRVGPRVEGRPGAVRVLPQRKGRHCSSKVSSGLLLQGRRVAAKHGFDRGDVGGQTSAGASEAVGATSGGG